MVGVFQGSAEEGKSTHPRMGTHDHGGGKEAEGGVEKGGVPRMKSLDVGVSWHVSHKIHEGHGVFFSDYSRPQTRPPSHN